MIRRYSAPEGPYVVGVDPGLAGGIAALGIDGTTLAAGPMPIARLGKNRREIDAGALAEFFGAMPWPPSLVVVERAFGMRGQGAGASFSFGLGFGKVLGAIETLGLPHQLVTPQAWKKSILAGTDKSKEAAVAYCRKRFPSVDLRPTELSKVPSDGIADALCLAEWARRLAVGEERDSA